MSKLVEAGEAFTSKFSRRNAWLRYGLALAVTSLAVLTRIEFTSATGNGPYVILMAAVMISGLLGGFGPGILATFLAALGHYYYFIDPPLTLSINKYSFENLIILGGFVAVGTFLNLILLGYRLNRRYLRASERRSRVILESAPMGLFLTDSNGNCIFANERWCKWAGMSAEEALGEGWKKALHPDDRERVFSEWQGAVRDGCEFRSEYRFMTPDGKTTWLSGRAVARSEVSEKGGFVGTVQDISKRKQAEEGLRLSNERLELAQKVGNIGTFDWDLETGKLVWSEELERLFDMKPGDFDGRLESWLEMLHPEDRGKAHEDLLVAIERKTELNIEYRICLPDGNERWIAARAQVYADENGRPLRMIGINRNVSARKQTERALNFLTEASKVLASSLNYETTISNVVKLAITNLADWCAIDMLDEQGKINRVTEGHSPRINKQAARRLEMRFNPRDEKNSAKAEVLKTGQPVIYHRLTPELLERMSDNPERVELLQTLGFSSLIIVPIQILGWAAGTITLALVGEGRHFSENDLLLAEGLGERAASAIDNAWLYRETKLARDELEDRVRERTVELSRLAAIVESSDDAIIGKSLDGIVTSWNKGAKQIYGYEESEIVGKSIATLVPSDRPDEITEILRRLSKGEHIKYYETDQVRKGGGRIHVSLTISPVTDLDGKIVGASTIARDITRRKKAEMELAYSQMRLEEAQQIAGLGSWEWDMGNDQLKWSSQMYRIFGVDPNEFIPNYDDIAEFTYPDDRERAKKEVQQATKEPGAIFNFEYRIQRPDKKIVDLYAQGRSVADERGKINRLVGTVLDITDRKRMERMKVDFVSLVSHQLKTPLAIIKGYTDNILLGITGDLTDKQTQYLKEMREIVMKYYYLIADLLNVSRIERGVISMDVKPVLLSGVIDGVVSSYSERAEQKGLKLVVKHGDEQIVVLADKEKMAEAISNVLDNALKFTQSGSITISSSQREDRGVVEVSDTGSGMDEDTLLRLFKKDQIFSGSPRPDGGSGLGLYIAKEFMSYQQGDISAFSQLGEGSKFTFTVPLAKVKASV